MQIQWFPGHMHKARKEVKETLSRVDLVIEILDARIPYSSDNPMISTLRGAKPFIKVLNKCDLADPGLTRQWQDYLEREKGVRTLAVSSTQPERVRQITELCRKLIPGKGEGLNAIHAMIVGIPNVGKSTIINLLTGRVIAKTGNEPAITKGQQKINLRNGIMLIDTPGMLWPNIENSHSGYRLAATGAIKDTAIDHADVAFHTAEYLLAAYPGLLRERYRLDATPAGEYELLEAFGRKRGCLRAGGHLDLDKAAKILLSELRSGAIGQVTLETPAMMERERIEVERIREEKAARKAQRLAARKRRSR
ncbi:MAG: ribosome biogenesis GTPase YlqF [Candidatus Sedimenticola endophacoides]